MELLRITGTHLRPSGRKESIGLFLCPHCDQEVNKVLSDRKRNKSCGCARVKHATTHGLTRGGKQHPLLCVYYGIRARCQNKNHSSYDRYGGRGIGVCKEWLDEPQKFFEWALANGWEKGLEIDRLDNDGDYSPENCRITTHQYNSQNRSSTKLNYELANAIRKAYRESGKTQKKVGEDFGVSEITVHRVIKNKTWINKEDTNA